MEQDSDPAEHQCYTTAVASVGSESYSTMKFIVIIFLLLLIFSLHSKETDLPSLSIESDTLDLTYWAQQQELETTWLSWMNDGRELSLKPIIHNKTAVYWTHRHRAFSSFQYTTLSYNSLNIGVSTNIPAKAKVEQKNWSFFGELNETGYCRNLIIGDYRIRWGQGLLFGQQVQKSSNFIVPHNQTTSGSFFRGAALQTHVMKMEILVMAGNNPIFADMEINRLRKVSGTTSNPGYRYLASGNKLAGIAFYIGNEHARIGYLAMNQSFQYDFTDSLLQKSNHLGSVTYLVQHKNLSFTGEYANAKQKDAVIHSIQWGGGGFQQRIEYFHSDAYFPSWQRGNSLHTPNSYTSSIIQYRTACKLTAFLDMSASFSYENREVLGTNHISRQYMKFNYHDDANNCIFSLQHRTQPSSQASDTTSVHTSLPLDVLRMQWEGTLSSEWTIGFTVQDKYYQTNAGIRKHGFYLVNSFGWNPTYMKAMLQITMLQTKSSVFIRDDDVGMNTEQQWQMGDDLSYRISVQLLKRIPLKIICKGSFWKRGKEQVQMEVGY